MKQHITSNVERIVCDSVETIFAIHNISKGGSVDREHLYDGKRTLYNVTARFMTFRTLHDIYGYSYHEISSHSHIGMRNVMRAVAKMREYIFNDALYKDIKEEIDKRVTQGLTL